MGYGHATLTVEDNGAAVLSGVLANGQAVNAGARIVDDGAGNRLSVSIRKYAFILSNESALTASGTFFSSPLQTSGVFVQRLQSRFWSGFQRHAE